MCLVESMDAEPQTLRAVCIHLTTPFLYEGLEHQGFGDVWGPCNQLPVGTEG